MAYLGNAYNDYDGYYTHGANEKVVCRYQAAASFSVTWAQVLIDLSSFGTGEKLKVVIYSESIGNEPDELLGESDEIIGATAGAVFGHIRANFQTPVSITSGSYYWIGVHTDSAVSIARKVGGTTRYNSDTYSDGAADPFGSTSTGTIDICITAHDNEDAFGFGDMGAGGSVMTASDGTVVSVFADTNLNSIMAVKDIDGTPVEDWFYLAMTMHGSGGSIVAIDAAIDSADDIHIISVSDGNGAIDVYYVNLTYSGGSWSLNAGGTILASYSESVPVAPGCAISIDSNDYPRVLFIDRVKQTGSTQDNVYYSHNVGSGWITPEQVGLRGNKADRYGIPRLTVVSGDDVEAMYEFWTDGDIAYRRRNGTWSSESVYTTYSPYIGNVTASASTIYRSNIDWDASNNNIEENDVDTSYNAGLSAIISPAYDSPDRYIFYLDEDNDVQLICNLDGAGWTSIGTLQTGTFYNIIAEWAYNHENQASGTINYIYEDEDGLIYHGVYSEAADLPFRQRVFRLPHLRM